MKIGEVVVFPGRALQKWEMTPRDTERKQRRTKDHAGLKVWRAAVWLRDEGQCRCCGVAVVKTDAAIPTRGDCHHIISRRHALTRTVVANGILLCAECHDRVHGRRRPRVVMQISATYHLGGREFPDASSRDRVRFDVVA